MYHLQILQGILKRVDGFRAILFWCFHLFLWFITTNNGSLTKFLSFTKYLKISYVSITRYLMSLKQKQCFYHIFTRCKVVSHTIVHILIHLPISKARCGCEVNFFSMSWALGGYSARAQSIAKQNSVETQLHAVGTP